MDGRRHDGWAALTIGHSNHALANFLGLLAPTQELLERYRKARGQAARQEYERGFLRLLRTRLVESRIDRALFARPTVLLCSEPATER